MIKILMVSTIGFSLYGMTSSIMNYYRNFDQSDMVIDFLSPNKVSETFEQEISKNGGRIYVIPGRNSNPFRYMLRLKKLLKIETYDIIHCHGNSATMAVELAVARYMKVPVRIAHCHNSTCIHLKFHRLLKPLFQQCYTKAFACSRLAGEWVFPKNDFTVIHNGISLSEFAYNEEIREEKRTQMGLVDYKVIGHIGHFSYQKNQEFLIRLFAEIYERDHNYRLLLVGEGDTIKECQDLVSTLKLKDAVIFFGETNDVKSLLQVIDVFVFPSRFEGLGIAVIEAQAAAVPCIVSTAIPLEANITNLVQYISLNDTLEHWVDKIMEQTNRDRKIDFLQNEERMNQSVYNIELEGIKLKERYVEFMREYNARSK